MTDARPSRIAGRNVAALLLAAVLVTFVHDGKQNVFSSVKSSVIPAPSILKVYHDHRDTNASRSEMVIPPFRPVQVLQRFIEQHSQKTLQSEWLTGSMNHRKYAVAYYWCPQRAGNILHSFINTVVWSIIHNRTLLWMYHNTSNQEPDCQAVLRRAPWLPSYLEWRGKLDLTEMVPVSNSPLTWESDQQHQVVLYPQIPDVLYHDKSIPRNAWSDHPLNTKQYQSYVRQLPSEFQTIAADLYEQGREFLYGMLYEKIFQLQRPTAFKIFGEIPENDQDLYTLALHSRHVVGADDGSYIPQEIECLEMLLRENYHHCVVHIMSDRPKTITLLARWLLEDKNCSVITASHDVGNGPVQEHGPWAGAGYLEDLDVTARARHGMVGDPHRSSTALLIDLIEYRRRISTWTINNQTNDNLNICKLPDKQMSGYDYGPGTPTFRHHPYLQPLSPVRVVSEFLTSSQHRKGTVLLSIDWRRPTIQQVYNVLNSWIVAIVNNMNVQWRNLPDDDICETGGSLAATIVFNVWEPEGSSIRESTMDELPEMLGNATNSENLVVLFLSDETMQYNLSAWYTLFDAPQGTESPVTKLLNDLFEHGEDVAYGLLFHELFRFCPFPANENNDIAAAYTLILALEHDESLRVENIQGCIESIISSPDDDDSISQALVDHDKSCHVYILSDRDTVEDSILSSIVDDPSTRTFPRLFLEEDGGTCTISYFYMETSPGNYSDQQGALLPSLWKQIEDASRARSGWIQPQEPRFIGHLGAAVDLVRKRLEYKRYYETWKQGREPFWIPELPKCYF